MEMNVKIDLNLGSLSVRDLENLKLAVILEIENRKAILSDLIIINTAWVRDHLMANRDRIKCIMELRQKINVEKDVYLGLRDAKDFVDNIWAEIQHDEVTNKLHRDTMKL